jgi:hypothetical protein
VRCTLVKEAAQIQNLVITDQRVYDIGPDRPKTFPADFLLSTSEMSMTLNPAKTLNEMI